MANAKKNQNWFGNKNKSGNSVPVRRGATNSNFSGYPASYFAPLSNFFRDMDRVFDNTLRNFPAFPEVSDNFLGMQNAFIPTVDIVSNDNEYTVKVEVPGIEEKDIKLNISADGMLNISGEKRYENTESRQNVECTECSYGAFERSLSLPDDIDQESIEARFKNGVLTITCPRTETSKAESRPIPINKGSGSIENQQPANTKSSNDKNVNQDSKRGGISVTKNT